MITTNFQDSSILNYSSTFYAVSGPNGNPSGINVQLATSADFETWTLHPSTGDLLPDPGPWAASPPHVWSPDINLLRESPYCHKFPPFPLLPDPSQLASVSKISRQTQPILSYRLPFPFLPLSMPLDFTLPQLTPHRQPAPSSSTTAPPSPPPPPNTASAPRSPPASPAPTPRFPRLSPATSPPVAPSTPTSSPTLSPGLCISSTRPTATASPPRGDPVGTGTVRHQRRFYCSG